MFEPEVKGKRPSFQFYPSDWVSDKALRACSLAARGLWMDMLCFMHDSPEYGYLLINNQPVGVEVLAKMSGESIKKIQKLIAELETFGVFSRRENDHCIFSKRMIRDEEIRRKRAEGGFKGGNPNLINNTSKVVNKVNLQANLLPTPSSSSSSSSSKYTPPTPSNSPEEKNECVCFEKFWSEYPKQVGKAAAKRIWGRQNLDARIDEILSGLGRQLTTDQWKRGFIPNPATFLQDERWLDEVKITPKAAKPYWKKLKEARFVVNRWTGEKYDLDEFSDKPSVDHYLVDQDGKHVVAISDLVALEDKQ